MPFTVKIEPAAVEDLKSIRVFDCRRIVQAIKEQLTHEPNVMTRNRKPLAELQAPFSGGLPLWELRVGDFRVLYDVDEDVVSVRAIRQKPPHQTTEQML
jgi:mRNA-degrading endonuclease RelE of RelBE toxin-antitoxin system